MGFEEGEIEMLEDMTDIEFNDIMEKYLEIANNPPYNLNWREENEYGADALNVLNSNGSEYTKHDIAKDVFNSYFHDEEMSAGKRGRKKLSKKQKKK